MRMIVEYDLCSIELSRIRICNELLERTAIAKQFHRDSDWNKIEAKFEMITGWKLILLGRKRLCNMSKPGQIS